ncbi:MAG: cytochrome b/b6 domain-containing protein [Pseudomonas sp.]|uniref:cytochrome b/b6 domain-containing protein n=1 Tax=Pseudomonas sp. TaxID=306 RepID=UPI0027161FBD|nr:cytochrome b/b6 domain-containing protein [Pseudomonas sp.]MDO9327871.1 cytochrome b/b6 domain-containing protein [Pseudomonas sp.]
MKPVTNISAHFVWDRFVRFFHWSLVSCVAFNYLVMSDGKTLHQWVGYLAVTMVLSRIVWGFVGSRHARFSDFFPTPSRVTAHVRQVRLGQHDTSLGHNPIGAIMMLALMAAILALGTTGWMQTLDAFWGDEWLQNLHSLIGNVLIAMATLHALAAIVMGRVERTRLIKAMVTGVKERW